MSEQTVARKRSRRAPSNSGETVAESVEDVVFEPTAPPVAPTPLSILMGTGTTAHRIVLGAVIVLGVLILLGVAILIIGFAKGWDKPKAPPANPMAGFHKPVSMMLEPGYRILSSDSQPGRLILHVRSNTSDEIYVIDTADGHMVATIRGEAPKQ